MKRSIKHVGALVSALAVAVASACVPAMAADPAPVPAMKARLAAKVPLTGLVRAGDALIAVGDYGTVVRSTDSGRTWIQADVPVSTLLTEAHFVDAQHGWVVGHGGVILTTTDGGVRWTLQQELADKPVLLSVHFTSLDKGFAVGAYGTAWRTTDGGRKWSPMKVGEGADADMHLNHLFATRSGALFIAAEGGLAFRSTDGGDTWVSLPTGVSGSLWSGLESGAGEIVLLGMSGRVLRSRDGGDSWQVTEDESAQSITAGVVDGDGGFIAVGSGGVVLKVHGRLQSEIRPDRQNLAAVQIAPDGAVVVAGQLGVERMNGER
ncbi:glycosyl hydrolase [Azoarcus sp. L1K30]|uniref:WD40/YVTN/BNR-like repeat-containing protein n=1 Tax=Azoarcus sp. L1K30 TaxID=2820277 RepID=UPI001B816586|nr:YCF48-related protein [Azoarcus sp. L1K30]MBR0566254.1 glycosyl hydrolase [Azoarcus sp. L1K30]